MRPFPERKMKMQANENGKFYIFLRATSSFKLVLTRLEAFRIDLKDKSQGGKGRSRKLNKGASGRILADSTNSNPVESAGQSSLAKREDDRPGFAQRFERIQPNFHSTTRINSFVSYRFTLRNNVFISPSPPSDLFHC